MAEEKETKISRQVAYQRRHKALGLCVRCPRRALSGHTLCRKHAMPVKIQRRPRWSQERINLFVQGWHSGLKVRTMAVMFKMSQKAVEQRIHFLRRHGYVLPSRHEPREIEKQTA
jgi:biotin operon repressor